MFALQPGRLCMSLKQVHSWADQKHVLILALAILAKQVPKEWIKPDGNLASNANKQL